MSDRVCCFFAKCFLVGVICLAGFSICYSSYNLVKYGSEYNDAMATEPKCSKFKATNIVMTTADAADLLCLVWFAFWAYEIIDKQAIIISGVLLIIFQLIEFGFSLGILTDFNYLDSMICMPDNSGIQAYFEIHYILAIVKTLIGSFVYLMLIIGCILSIPSPVPRENSPVHL
ncbi:MAG: hypothetical protein Hyperionvirus7_82 [Hyperionvirus sp.]|uniref:Uncharacterized protein n=1 Tax=Hyperionvirus sp. TaxID=2487770 RepID=A0A3G5AB81_9VIRU|nr:MAG: hypothetical protein Hyperionvirus7_82 [Hyperionvirus sp.]